MSSVSRKKPPTPPESGNRSQWAVPCHHRPASQSFQLLRVCSAVVSFSSPTYFTTNTMAGMGMRSQPNRFSVYVGNIPYQTTEESIGNYFSQAGNVTNVRIVYDRETGRPKGFGFCEFSDEAGAQNAVNTLNGADFNGRSLRVNMASRN
ncbi:hypothetical protein OESDEN_12274 [Oesophagostomum dentatum]|uniref:RRM domain-containing protein n=1 Tax=Oesophagostomum dentatum TaxID=61180 RepID=A0A0B1SRI9_OESDE|nr:hypothetical protein OESDEN_12274 [Oesophagostomum dentatum]